jgi:hypothetical protein
MQAVLYHDGQQVVPRGMELHFIAAESKSIE